ncbi:hypothetical protein NQ314_016854 [Rhamnusium bicolor]|uniref:Uncharacterized protein n=1 Tax=Rhamnusium bicolor TaxID=1586634 RepID=A0AAV8WW20_9CUCU|nr:hypothetical protein NQ314_016854 [Rhamnusium bicolor]
MNHYQNSPHKIQLSIGILIIQILTEILILFKTNQNAYPAQRNFAPPQFANNYSTHSHNQFPSLPINVQPRQVNA